MDIIKDETKKELDLQAISVPSDSQGQGLGTAILQEIHKLADAEGVTIIGNISTKQNYCCNFIYLNILMINFCYNIKYSYKYVNWFINQEFDNVISYFLIVNL